MAISAAMVQDCSEGVNVVADGRHAIVVVAPNPGEQHPPRNQHRMRAYCLGGQ